MRARGTWLVAAALLGGCAVGPDYQRPDLTLPQRWRIDVPQSAAIANTRWWEQFDDPVLSALIGEALRANTDLAIAAARVEQFAGALTAARSQLYPQIGYNAQA